MAKSTFTLRNAGVAGDSTNVFIYTVTNGLQELADKVFYLEANPSDYGVIDISWDAPLFPLTDNLLPADVHIRYSFSGEPETVDDGFPLVQVTEYSDYIPDENGDITFNTLVTDTYPASGKVVYDLHQDSSASVFPLEGNWIYLTMFLRNASTYTDAYIDVDQYFEKVASVGILLPKNYGSTEDLWTRIPQFLRQQDIGNHLYDYLSIFGWDLDYFRTIIDYLMVQRDPMLANTTALQYMMEELGALITTVELGAIRARNYMQDIVNLRLSKGTETGITKTIQAIAGSPVIIDTVTNKINVSPQRVNWMREPRVALGIDPNPLSYAWYGYQAPSDIAPVETYLEFGPTGDVASLTFGADRLTFSIYDTFINNGASAQDMYVYTKYTVPYTASDSFYFSASTPAVTTTDMTDLKVFMYDTGVIGGIAASAGFGTNNYIYRAGTTAGASGGYYLLETAPNTEGAQRAFIVLKATLAPGGSCMFSHFLLENNYIGSYFDGSTNDGGWLRGLEPRPDYHWVDIDSPPMWFKNYMYIAAYTANAWKTWQTLLNIYHDIIPVNCEYDLIIDWVNPPDNPFEYLSPGTLSI